MATNKTCKVSETAEVVERVVRRWVGVPLELSIRPQADGLCVVTIQTPSGVDTPSDPGQSPTEAALDAALLMAAAHLARLAAMTAARDASDAEIERLRAL